MKIAARPDPIATTPAFSPGPCMTCGPFVGSVFNYFFDDLYEQCSDHIEEKMPTSVGLGVRSKIFKISLYSSDERPCCKARISDLSSL